MIELRYRDLQSVYTVVQLSHPRERAARFMVQLSEKVLSMRTQRAQLPNQVG